MEGCYMVRSMSATACTLDLEGVVRMDEQENYGPHARCFEWAEIENPENRFVQCHLAKV